MKKNKMVSKYRNAVLDLLDKQRIQSTNEVSKLLQERAKKVIAWNTIYRILEELKNEGKAEKLSSRSGFFWRRK